VQSPETTSFSAPTTPLEKEAQEDIDKLLREFNKP
jgi:hypothetical protein